MANFSQASTSNPGSLAPGGVGAWGMGHGEWGSDTKLESVSGRLGLRLIRLTGYDPEISG